MEVMRKLGVQSREEATRLEYDGRAALLCCGIEEGSSNWC